MTIEGVLVDAAHRRYLAIAAYVAISVFSGMAILLFVFAMAYQAIQLFNAIF